MSDDDDDKSLLERLLSRADYFAAGRWPATETLDGRAAKAIKRLTQERDKARAAQASARNDALEEAAKWHDYESLMNRVEAGQRGQTDGDYWHFIGRADQHQSYAAAIRAMKREPADD